MKKLYVNPMYADADKRYKNVVFNFAHPGGIRSTTLEVETFLRRKPFLRNFFLGFAGHSDIDVYTFSPEQYDFLVNNPQANGFSSSREARERFPAEITIHAHTYALEVLAHNLHQLYQSSADPRSVSIVWPKNPASDTNVNTLAYLNSHY